MTELLAAIYPAQITILQIIGVIGFVIYVVGFLLVQTGHVCGNGILFPASKVVAALCVICSLTEAYNLATLLMQISFVCVGSYGVLSRLRMYRRARYHDIERPVVALPQNG